MSVTLATGAQVAIASVYGVAKAMSVVTNAIEAVATLEAAHGVIVNDILEVTSGWGRLDKRIVRASAVATNDVTFDDIDTSSVSKYPAGQGIGSVREITTWVDISQIQNASAAGGDQQYADITFLTDVIQKQIPTIRSPVSLTLTFFDDPLLAWYPVVRAASDSSTPTAIRITFANGSKLYGNAYWSLQTIPNMESQQALTARIDLTFAAEPTRYAT